MSRELGAHVGTSDPLASAHALDAQAVQVFLSNPQSWKKPKPRDDAEAILASDLAVYVHAPYLVNVASANNRIRIPSRKILSDTCEAAAAIGARAVIVHGGHVTDDEAVDQGFGRWRKALETLEWDIPIMIENTAGGTNALSRDIEVVAALWDEIGDLSPGFCLDTCHAWSAGEPFDGLVDRVIEATGAIDLMHCNDSRDDFESRRDRHANLGQGTIPEAELMSVLRATVAPIIIETPGGQDEHRADLDWLRARL
ncbi:MAG: deoxyribonuclease IV [Acidimicrobiia bacterium]